MGKNLEAPRITEARGNRGPYCLNLRELLKQNPPLEETSFEELQETLHREFRATLPDSLNSLWKEDPKELEWLYQKDPGLETSFYLGFDHSTPSHELQNAIMTVEVTHFPLEDKEFFVRSVRLAGATEEGRILAVEYPFTRNHSSTEIIGSRIQSITVGAHSSSSWRNNILTETEKPYLWTSGFITKAMIEQSQISGHEKIKKIDLYRPSPSCKLDLYSPMSIYWEDTNWGTIEEDRENVTIVINDPDVQQEAIKIPQHLSAS